MSEIEEPDSNVTSRSNKIGTFSGRLPRAQNAERRNADVVFYSPGPIGTVPDPNFARDMVPGQVRMPVPVLNKQQAVFDYSDHLDHTAQLAVIFTGKKRYRAAAGAGDGCNGDSSYDSSDSEDSYKPQKGRYYESNIDDDIVARQGIGNRGKRPVVSSLPSASTSSDDKDKGIVDRIDAIRKGRRL